MRPTFFHHLHPPTLPAAQARWTYTLGAGGMALFLLAVLIVTGALELFYYIPTPEQAALSIQTLTYLVPFGGLVRHMHFWAGQALVGVALIHLLRVLYTGAYAPPRRYNYLVGLVCFGLILLLDWSGYVLRYDEGVRWALIVGTQLINTIPVVGEGLYRVVVGGSTPGPATLMRFYAAHIFGLTLLLVGLVGWHLFRVRRDGGIAAPPPAQRADPRRITRFDLVRREALAAILATVGLLWCSAFVPAPLAPPMQSLGTSASAASGTGEYAPWFFLWVQGLVRLGDPFWLGVVAPGGVVLLLAALPFVLPTPSAGELGRWFPRGGRLAQVVTSLIVLLLILLTLWSRLP